MIKWYEGGEYYFRDMLFSVALVTFQNFLKKHKTFLFQGGWIIWIVVCVCVVVWVVQYFWNSVR